MSFSRSQEDLIRSIEKSETGIKDAFKRFIDWLQMNNMMLIIFMIPIGFFVGAAFNAAIGISLIVLSYGYFIAFALFLQRWMFKMKIADGYGVLNAEQLLPSIEYDDTIETVITKIIPVQTDVNAFAELLLDYIQSTKSTLQDVATLPAQVIPTQESDSKNPVNIENTYGNIQLQKLGTQADPKTESSSTFIRFRKHIEQLQLTNHTVWYLEVKRAFSLNDKFFKRFFIVVPKDVKSLDELWLRTNRALFIEGVFGEAKAYVPILCLAGEWRNFPLYVTLQTKDEIQTFMTTLQKPPNPTNISNMDVKIGEQFLELNFGVGFYKQTLFYKNRLKEESERKDTLTEGGTNIERDLIKFKHFTNPDNEPTGGRRRTLFFLFVILLGIAIWYSGHYHWGIELPPIFGDPPGTVAPSGGENQPPQTTTPISGDIGLILLRLSLTSLLMIIGGF